MTKGERQKAKPINFGKPGGMGNLSLQDYARTSYGVVLTDAEVERLSEAWFRQFPEMREFLRDHLDLGEEEARFFDLTPETYFEHTGSRKFLDHPDNAGGGRRPHPALGGMALKVLKQRGPADPRRAVRTPPRRSTTSGRRSRPGWARSPPTTIDAVRDRLPSAALQRAAMKLVGRAGVFTLTGRLRANASYSARHNNIFQGLAADGAKLALWKLWRAGYRIVNFIHDEVLVEVPAGSDLDRHAGEVRRLMIEGMTEVVPDVRVEVECVAATAWSKQAEVVRDAEGRLLAWSPPAAPTP